MLYISSGVYYCLLMVSCVTNSVYENATL